MVKSKRQTAQNRQVARLANAIFERPLTEKNPQPQLNQEHNMSIFCIISQDLSKSLIPPARTLQISLKRGIRCALQGLSTGVSHRGKPRRRLRQKRAMGVPLPSKLIALYTMVMQLHFLGSLQFLARKHRPGRVFCEKTRVPNPKPGCWWDMDRKNGEKRGVRRGSEGQKRVRAP